VKDECIEGITIISSWGRRNESPIVGMLGHCCPVDGGYDFSIALQDKGF